MRTAVLVLGLSLLVSVATAYAAETGTPNMMSAQVRSSPRMGWQVEVRSYPGSGNIVWAGGVSKRLAENAELDLWYNHLDIEGEDPIAGAVRHSQWTAVSASLKLALRHRPEDSVRWAVIPELNYSTTRPRAQNAGSATVTEGPRMIPAVAVAGEWTSGPTTLILEPKFAWFDTPWHDSSGGAVTGFGNLLTVGGGIIHQWHSGELVGDAAYPINGNNAVSETTGAAARKLVWSAGYRRPIARDGRVQAEVYLTNTAGPSVAESMVGTRGSGTGVGLRISGEF